MRRNLRPSTLDNYEKKISTFKIGKVEYFLLFITDFQETLEATGVYKINNLYKFPPKRRKLFCIYTLVIKIGLLRICN